MPTAGRASSDECRSADPRVRPVRVLRHVWVPLGDGTRLAARVWLPAGARGPVPAVLEYGPYRKNDGTAARDATLHGQFAQAGYAAVRVDCRGSGDSDGVGGCRSAEPAGVLGVLEWIAAQEWSDGQVALLGMGRGGFLGLRVAALGPPQLRCVVSVCSADGGYPGGALPASELLPWSATMLAYDACPGDPAVLGEEVWRARWRERLEAAVPYAGEWLGCAAHRRAGAGGEEHFAVKVPVYAVGGWLDPHRGAVLRLVAGPAAAAGVPVKGLIGPWAHGFPHQAEPGPGMDFQGECVRWFDRWMRDVPNGITDEPRLRVWLPDPVPVGSDREVRPGRWVAEPSWPAPGVTRSELPLAGLGGGAGGTAVLRSPLALGAAAGDFLKSGDVPGQYGDQAADDGRAHCFTGPPLPERLEILGVPEVTLRVTSDRPQAQLAVRLCEVAPDGTSRLVTAGLLNLTHREGDAEPRPLEPGRAYEVTVSLPAIGHAFAAGSRVRVAVSASLWPWAWPSPERVALALDTGHGALALPVRVPRPAEEGALRPFGPPREGPPHPVWRTPLPGERHVAYDAESGEQVVTTTPADGVTTDRTDGLTRSGRGLNRFRIVEGDPGSATVESEREEHISRDGWSVRIRTRSRMTADARDFCVTHHLAAYEGTGDADGEEREVFARTWTGTVPRGQV